MARIYGEKRGRPGSRGFYFDTERGAFFQTQAPGRRLDVYDLMGPRSLAKGFTVTKGGQVRFRGRPIDMAKARDPRITKAQRSRETGGGQLLLRGRDGHAVIARVGVVDDKPVIGTDVARMLAQGYTIVRFQNWLR